MAPLVFLTYFAKIVRVCVSSPPLHHYFWAPLLVLPFAFSLAVSIQYQLYLSQDAKTIMLCKRCLLCVCLVLCLFKSSVNATVEKKQAKSKMQEASAVILHASVIPLVNGTQQEEVHVEDLATDVEANHVHQVVSNAVEVEKQDKQQVVAQYSTKPGFVLATGLIVIGVMVAAFRKRKISVREKEHNEMLQSLLFSDMDYAAM